MRISLETIKLLISLGDINAHKAYVFTFNIKNPQFWTYYGVFYLLDNNQWYQTWDREVLEN